MAKIAEFYAKFDEAGEPAVLFRVYLAGGGADEQVFKPEQGQWVAAEGFLEDVIEGSFDYGPIEESKAKAAFPEAFADEP